jgi:hypothetical protein
MLSYRPKWDAERKAAHKADCRQAISGYLLH